MDASYLAAEGVYAIGDVIGGAMLAHKAEEEGVACVGNRDRLRARELRRHSRVVYTQPEIATVGRTEDELKAEAPPTGRRLLLRANARALDRPDRRPGEGARRHRDRPDPRVHIIGPRAGDMIAEAVAAMEFGASSEDLARTCHAHPTLAEALKEAALAVDSRAIHN